MDTERDSYCGDNRSCRGCGYLARKNGTLMARGMLVNRDDHPVAVIFPHEVFQQWVTAREQRLRQARRNLQTWVSEDAEVLTGLDSVELIREARSRQWRVGT